MQMLGNGVGPARARSPCGCCCRVWRLVAVAVASRTVGQQCPEKTVGGSVWSRRLSADQQPGRARARPSAGETGTEKEGLEPREKNSLSCRRFWTQAGEKEPAALCSKHVWDG